MPTPIVPHDPSSSIPPGIFSIAFRSNRPWSTTSFWTKYCILCTVCGSAATILAGIFLVVAALFRYYTTSIYYFETVPTYIPAILLSICGVSTIAFSCKRNRNIILLRITACWSLVSAALSSVITITTSLIHMNRLQTLKECVYNRNPPGCTCFGHSYGIDNQQNGGESTHFVFENTPDCDVIHGILYSCLRAVFAISVVAVLLSIFLCMLLYQLIGHERKKAYWSRIRRINSDWSADFLACLARPMPRERSSLIPLMMTPSNSTAGASGLMQLPTGLAWGPPPPYDIGEQQAQGQGQGQTSQPRNSRHVTFFAIPPMPLSSTALSLSSSASSNSDFLMTNVAACTSFSPTIAMATTIPVTPAAATVSTSTAVLPSASVPVGPPMLLRESKISIESGNLNSLEEDLSYIDQVHPPGVVDLVLQNYSYLTATPEPEQSQSQPQESRTKLSSLPSSPLLNSVKNFLMQKRNSAANTPIRSRRNYKEMKSQSLPGSPMKMRVKDKEMF